MNKLIAAACAAACVAVSAAAHADAKNYGPGVTDTEVKIGQTMPYSGPASSFAAIGRAMTAYFEKLNAEGGVNGRKINLISLDDGYSPSKAVEQTRRLVESDEVLAIVGTFGSPTNFAIQKYLNVKKVPGLFLGTGANRVSEPKTYPWSMGWQPNNHAKGVIYAKYLLKERPNAKVAVLYQNDDFGRDYAKGFRDGLGDKADSMILKELSYEVTEPTVDSQILLLKSTGADVFLNISTPKFSAQAIKKMTETKWEALHLLSDAAGSISSTLVPAGLENSKGVITVAFRKDPNDPVWANDPGMKQYLDFMKQYMPNADPSETYYVFGYATAQTFEHVLRACGDNLTRENLMKQAASIKDLELPILLPGIKLNTSATHYTPMSQEQLMQFDGTRWKPIGTVIDAEK
ncbi:amino acid/amide ABC transporter substrate-binding protein (HAAT family) [Rhodopseudomonas thermotolerans]|uniref:Amino acid/amide ABC transporter substrate-binding protein (HAAT family) n=2 Tax=Rhodopseudomonas TaxID=1073 RepID=A0A336JT83_9BRAD|nr:MULTISPECIES: ABC transporter substrate-binding protein [Rhodopseudomonas]RED41924.1 amino acid/amide ABC transporter substrate-binding protein (HAAT family) [Rhodopseudomonas pentothenatexigens]REG07385.1 amino acid/amide ABC transporter substrate-binding protein (HAAT family) [Rhodopseudomonas thermotolerans]SSW89281.1 amino acid/amide ABC transporter substrate-binding protein (HAAT family) [Rhodopseudomonas pentothenatexigens]